MQKTPGCPVAARRGAASRAPGELPYRLVVELEFLDEEHMQSALNSAAGQAMARDYPNFATGDARILFCRSSALDAHG